MVSIPQWCDCCRLLVDVHHHICACFNPTMVRLLLALASLTPPFPICFNPTMVRLLRQGSEAARLRLESFNPTMVRLLQRQRKASAAAACGFQSHNGAIAACAVDLDIEQHKRVSIPQWCDCCPLHHDRRDAPNPGFNPTMVRLLPVSQTNNLCQEPEFQSHNGAIAANSGRCGRCP